MDGNQQQRFMKKKKKIITNEDKRFWPNSDWMSSLCGGSIFFNHAKL